MLPPEGPAVPLAQGRRRSAAGAGAGRPCGKENEDPRPEAVKQSNILPEVDKSAKDAFEASIASGEGDIVQVWRDYLAWAGDAPPLLERACESLAADPRHAGDVRHLRLWVRLASEQPRPHETFEELEREGIGLAHALLYEAWAASLERQHLFEAAAEAYERGVGRGAQPLDRLRSRFEEFQGRMRKRACRGEARARGRGEAPRPPLDNDPGQPGGVSGRPVSLAPSASPQASLLSSPGQDSEALLNRWTRERALESAQRNGGSAYQTPQHGAFFQTPRYSDSTAVAGSLCSSARASTDGGSIIGRMEQQMEGIAAQNEDSIIGRMEQQMEGIAAQNEELERQIRASAGQAPPPEQLEAAEGFPCSSARTSVDGAGGEPQLAPRPRPSGGREQRLSAISTIKDASECWDSVVALELTAASAQRSPSAQPAEPPGAASGPAGAPWFSPAADGFVGAAAAARRPPSVQTAATAEARAGSGRPPSRWAATPVTTASSTLFRGPGGGLAGAPLQWRRSEPDAHASVGLLAEPMAEGEEQRQDEDGAPSAELEEAASPPRWSALRVRSPQPPLEEAAVAPAAAGHCGSTDRGRPRAGHSPAGPPRWSALRSPAPAHARGADPGGEEAHRPPRRGSLAASPAPCALPQPPGGAAESPSTPPSCQRAPPSPGDTAAEPPSTPPSRWQAPPSPGGPGAEPPSTPPSRQRAPPSPPQAPPAPPPRTSTGAAPRAVPAEDVSVEERRAAALLAGLGARYGEHLGCG